MPQRRTVFYNRMIKKRRRIISKRILCDLKRYLDESMFDQKTEGISDFFEELSLALPKF